MLVNIVSSGENIDSGLFPDRGNIPEVGLETSNCPIISQESVSLTNKGQADHLPFSASSNKNCPNIIMCWRHWPWRAVWWPLMTTERPSEKVQLSILMTLYWSIVSEGGGGVMTTDDHWATLRESPTEYINDPLLEYCQWRGWRPPEQWRVSLTSAHLATRVRWLICIDNINITQDNCVQRYH